MNDKLAITKQDDRITRIEVIDEHGNKTKVDSSVSVTDLELQNKIEATENVYNKVEKLKTRTREKMHALANALRVNGIVIIAAMIALLATSIATGVGAIGPLAMYISAGVTCASMLSTMVIGVIDTYYDILNDKYLNIMLDLLNEVQNEEVEDVKEDVMQLQISNKLIDDLNNRYVKKYGTIYKDIDYKYSKIEEQKEPEIVKEDVSSTKPKTLGQYKSKAVLDMWNKYYKFFK